MTQSEPTFLARPSPAGAGAGAAGAGAGAAGASCARRELLDTTKASAAVMREYFTTTLSIGFRWRRQGSWRALLWGISRMHARLAALLGRGPQGIGGGHERRRCIDKCDALNSASLLLKTENLTLPRLKTSHPMPLVRDVAHDESMIEANGAFGKPRCVFKETALHSRHGEGLD